MADSRASDRTRKEGRIVSKHIDPAFSADPESIIETPAQSSNTTQSSTTEEQESSLKLQGGDIHRDIYKLAQKAKQQPRSKSFSHRRPSSSSLLNESAEVQKAPGAFRRQFLLQQRRFNSVTTPVTKNFVSFLDLYGSFAGEDLAESDEEDETDTTHRDTNERRPLLGRRKSSRVPTRGDAGMTKTFFLLLKSFIGTGVLFLPKAFKNGGLLFSSVTMVTLSLVTCIAFHLLLKCRSKYGGGYGELGETIVGPKTRTVILGSITLSQLGFVCAGIIFTAENLYSFLDAVIKGPAPMSISALILIQLLLLVPLALIRNISKLGSSALLADVCILLGLGYIYWYDMATLSTKGIQKTVELFNPRDYTLTVGSAIFAFEGIGLILPVQSSMAEPHKFSRLLYLVMFIITVIFTSVGALSYATFGDQTNTEIISNFPQSNKLVNAVQFLYSLAILVGTPVQLFPAMRILEAKYFGHLSGKRDVVTKWKKNAFRTSIVCFCGVVSALGAANLDKFVALIGSFCCIPLVYLLPAFLHYKGIATSRLVKTGDILLMMLGAVAMVYTTAVTLTRG